MGAGAGGIEAAEGGASHDGTSATVRLKPSQTPTTRGKHSPRPDAEAIEYLLTKNIVGWDRNTVGNG